jgi:hypothetical protein
MHELRHREQIEFTLTSSPGGDRIGLGSPYRIDRGFLTDLFCDSILGWGELALACAIALE